MNIHQDTNSAVNTMLYRLHNEAKYHGENPIFTIIQEALYLLQEASKNSMSFNDYGDVLGEIQDRLDEKNDGAYEVREETNRDVISWLEGI